MLWFILKRECVSSRKSNLIFLAFLTSPMFFFVNYMMGEQSIYGIFLMLLSIYLLHYDKEKGGFDFFRALAGSLLLAYSSFLYYFPLLAVVPIVVFGGKNKINFIKMTMIIASFLSFYLLFYQILSYSLLRSGNTQVSASGFIPVFNILALLTKGIISQPYTPFLATIQTSFTYLFFFIAFALPLIARWLRISFFSTLLAIIAFSFILLRIYNWDEFLWIFPLLCIVIAVESNSSFLKTKLFGSQLYYMPILILYNMWSAPSLGQGTGIFFLTYLQFGQAIPGYSFFQSPLTVTQILSFTNFIALASILLFALHPRKIETELIKSTNSTLPAKEKGQLGNKDNHHHICSFRQNPIFVITERGKSGRFLKFTILAITLFLLIPTVLLTPYFPSGERTISYDGGSFPLGLFQSNNYVMNKSLTYSVVPADNNTILFSNYSGTLVKPSYFSRVVSNESLNSEMSFHSLDSKNVTNTIVFLALNNISVEKTSQVKIGSGGLLIPPNLIENMTKNVTRSPIITVNESIPVFSSGNNKSMLRYGVPLTVNSPEEFVFSFKISTLQYPVNQVYLATIGNYSYQLYYSESGSIYFGVKENETWNNVLIQPVNSFDSWNFVSLLFIHNRLNFYLNGLQMGKTNSIFNNSDLILKIGRPYELPTTSYQDSFVGTVTELVSSSPTNYSVVHRIKICQGSRCVANMPFIDHQIYVNRSQNSVNITYSNRTSQLLGSYSQFSFGRFSNYYPSIEYSFKFIKLTHVSSTLLIQVVIISAETPVIIAVYFVGSYSLTSRQISSKQLKDRKS